MKIIRGDYAGLQLEEYQPVVSRGTCLALNRVVDL